MENGEEVGKKLDESKYVAVPFMGKMILVKKGKEGIFKNKTAKKLDDAYTKIARYRFGSDNPEFEEDAAKEYFKALCKFLSSVSPNEIGYDNLKELIEKMVGFDLSETDHDNDFKADFKQLDQLLRNSSNAARENNHSEKIKNLKEFMQKRKQIMEKIDQSLEYSNKMEKEAKRILKKTGSIKSKESKKEESKKIESAKEEIHRIQKATHKALRQYNIHLIKAKQHLSTYDTWSDEIKKLSAQDIDTAKGKIKKLKTKLCMNIMITVATGLITAAAIGTALLQPELIPMITIALPLLYTLSAAFIDSSAFTDDFKLEVADDFTFEHDEEEELEKLKMVHDNQKVINGLFGCFIHAIKGLWNVNKKQDKLEQKSRTDSSSLTPQTLTGKRKGLLRFFQEIGITKNDSEQSAGDENEPPSSLPEKDPSSPRSSRQ